MEDVKYSLGIMKEEIQNKYISPEIKYAFNTSIKALEIQASMLELLSIYEGRLIDHKALIDNDGWDYMQGNINGKYAIYDAVIMDLKRILK